MIKKLFQSTIARIMMVVIALVLPINIMTLVLVQTVLKSNQEKVNTEIQNSLEGNVEGFQRNLDAIYKRLLRVSVTEADIREFAGTLENNTVSEKARLLNSASNTVKEIRQEYETIDLVYMYFPQNDYFIKYGYPVIKYEDYKDIIENLSDGDDRTPNLWATMEIEDIPVTISAKKWQDVQFGILLNMDTIADKLSLPDYADDRCIFVSNMEETIFSEEGKAYLAQEAMTLEELKESSEYYVFNVPLQDYDLQIYEVVRKSSLDGSIPNAIRAIQILAIVLTIAAIPLLLFSVRKWVWAPLNHLTKAMDKIEQGNLDYRVKEQEKSAEFQKINHNFNQMMDQVQHLKIDVYEQELEKKNITMDYLSHQIQPHFILNAMNILYSYEPEEYELSQKMILCISKYFRYIVKVNAKFVSLQQEMDHIINYFEIQKARFPGLFFSIVEYEEGLKDALIPPLLVQNFIENSIKHSLKVGNKITILVVAEYYRTEGQPLRMRIRMADTGEGIQDDILAEIKAFQETGIPQEHLGVGIQNAIERLKYLYDKQKTSIRFWRDEHYKGTNVELILPIYFKGETEDENLIG